MQAVEAAPDPLDAIPDPHVLRRQIAEHVQRAELLRLMLRLALRRERLQDGNADDGKVATDGR